MKAVQMAGTALCGLAMLSVACHAGGGSSAGGSSVSAVFPVSPSAPVSAGFSVSGVVTEFRGGPVPGVVVTARPNAAMPADSSRHKTVLTDARGAFRIEGLTEPTIIDAAKDGFEPAGYGAVSGNTTVNVTLNRRLRITAGETLQATIWGDSEMSGEDWTGSNCDVHDAAGVHDNGCVLVHVLTYGPGRLTARLRWNAPGNEMGVFISTGWFNGVAAHGTSPAEASLDVVGGDTLVVVSFERANGTHPIPSQAAQAFELATSFVGR